MAQIKAKKNHKSQNEPHQLYVIIILKIDLKFHHQENTVNIQIELVLKA